mgnify:CR=1 FL=1
MVASLDGATTANGVSGALGGDADRRVFRAVRGVGDVIMAGAGTMRAESYGPVTLADEVIAARRDAGRDTTPPRLVAVTSRLDLDPTDAIFSGDAPAIVITTAAVDPGERARFEAITDVIVAGDGPGIDVRRGLGALADLGVDVVVLEGGPTLNGAFHAVDAIDELCMTVDPTIVGGDSHRVVNRGPSTGRDHRFRLDSLLIEDDVLCGRWVRDRT